MKKGVRNVFVTTLVLGAFLATPAPAQETGRGQTVNAVFVMTNSVDKNEIISFLRATDGSLQEGDTFVTGGAEAAAILTLWNPRDHLR